MVLCRDICSSKVLATAIVLCFFFDIAVTIYVRKEEEKAYNALMLDTLTADALRQAVSIQILIFF